MSHQDLLPAAEHFLILEESKLPHYAKSPNCNRPQEEGSTEEEGVRRVPSELVRLGPNSMKTLERLPQALNKLGQLQGVDGVVSLS